LRYSGSLFLEATKKTLRRLEKAFRDAVIDELKAGMIEKKKVDHKTLGLLVLDIRNQAIRSLDTANGKFLNLKDG
jgi:hypothetical protein